MSAGTKINFHAHHDDETYTNESWVTECDREEVLAVHREWHESVLRLFSASKTWYKWALYDRDPFHTGPGAGQRCSAMRHIRCCPTSVRVFVKPSRMAVLSAALAASPEDVPAALQVYERIRQPRAAGLSSRHAHKGLPTISHHPLRSGKGTSS